MQNPALEPVDLDLQKGSGSKDDYLFQLYESSLVYWLIAFGILGIFYYSVLIYLKIKMGDKWKDGIIKWMLGWYLDKSQKQINITKNKEFFEPIFERIKNSIGDL
jgi:hypothetical protein